ncbi:MAG: SPOR domain-containing protein [Gammaproteobacteria bacterium]|nr:SPOR domain-containing protein [Gammaproteobacteria bacterium]
MNKSQLRKLAREYALGNFEEGDYLQRRRALVDDIVSGKVAIVREVPPPPPPAYSEDPTTKVSIGGRTAAQRVTPAALLIAIVVIAGIIWMLIPPGVHEDATVDQTAHAPPLSRARSLIDEFVNEKDFSAFSIASFKESWSHLTYEEKREAYSAQWFNKLVHLISDEIEEQNDLLDSGDTANATEMGRRLSQFASFLGISEYVTEFKGVPAHTAATVSSSNRYPEVEPTAKVNEPAPQQSMQRSARVDASRKDPGAESTTTVNAIATQRSLPSSTIVDASDSDLGVELASVNDAALQDRAPSQPPASRHETLTLMADGEWLGDQPVDAFTLQLFAVNQLEEIQDLVASNPDSDLRVLVSARNEPRYRVIYGVFESEEAARGAYAELPEYIRQARPVAAVKSLSRLRDEVGNADRIALVEASKYTLQVFATDSADIARRLQADYPTLELSLLETSNPYTRYRVLYGIFDSEEMAKQAAGRLPLELLKNVGDPLIKTVSELQAVKR